jgi:hypothetical protein
MVISLAWLQKVLRHSSAGSGNKDALRRCLHRIPTPQRPSWWLPLSSDGMLSPYYSDTPTNVASKTCFEHALGFQAA